MGTKCVVDNVEKREICDANEIINYLLLRYCNIYNTSNVCILHFPCGESNIFNF